MDKKAGRSGGRPKAADEKESSLASTSEDFGGNSLVRMLSLLDLFTSAAPAWSSDALIRVLGTSRSTGYRYIKALADVGLLTPVSNGHYILGPRIIELDLQIRNCDPLYNAAGPELREITEATGFTALVCALFSGSVLCVREHLAPDSPARIFSRGQRRPLFRGAASKVILAYLGPHQLRSIYGKHERTIATAGIGNDWASFREALASIRRAGYATSIGEFNPGVFGVAAPIFNSGGQILGSIGLAGDESKFNPNAVDSLARVVTTAGKKITDRVAVIGIGTDRPARAVG